MPIYEYKCQDCNQRFEEITSSAKNDQPVRCKSCNSVNTRRVISAAGYRVGSKASSSGCSGKSGFS
ncbi:MAG: hypothetical protein CSB24_07245 [Deltaproteobacteria bacterium]|nr:MAG: hypothetical protein CSB24_07245 [Deltaproteobacteria bacterium]